MNQLNETGKRRGRFIVYSQVPGGAKKAEAWESPAAADERELHHWDVLCAIVKPLAEKQGISFSEFRLPYFVFGYYHFDVDQAKWKWDVHQIHEKGMPPLLLENGDCFAIDEKFKSDEPTLLDKLDTKYAGAAFEKACLAAALAGQQR